MFNEDLLQQFSYVIVDSGGIVRTWREKVWEKYSSLPGIRELHVHDFVTIAVLMVMKVCE